MPGAEGGTIVPAARQASTADDAVGGRKGRTQDGQKGTFPRLDKVPDGARN